MTSCASRILLSLVAVAALSCRSTSPGPRGSSTDAEPLPAAIEDGPSALQRKLAALTPVATGASEDTRRLDEALAAFHARTPSRRAYIAVDKPLYQPGETIWLRTFELFSKGLAGDPTTTGTTLQLISPKGAVVLEKRVQSTAGVAHNDFVLPTDVPGGEYVLRATSDHGTTVERPVIVASYQAPRIKKKLEFTRKAYGPGDTVAAAVALHRATGEALASHAVTGLVQLDGTELARLPLTTDGEGNVVVRFELPGRIVRGDGLLTVLVEDGGVTESIQRRVPITLDTLQFSMFPEGGDLVTGLPGRVYFSARNPQDEPADVEGRIVDDAGVVVAKFRSVHDGLGRFEIVARAGKTYHAEITKPAGIEQRFELPSVADSGCAMQALDDFRSRRDDVRVAVWCSSARDVVATAVQRDDILGTVSARIAAAEPTVLSLPGPGASQGAVRVTLFDDELEPLAERLVYANLGEDLEITLRTDRESYNPRDQVTLDIEARDARGKPVVANLALAVADDTVLSFADDEQAHIRARLYLESEMPGQEIEKPDFYFSDDPKAPVALDLVLGTQGWRRFDWEQVLVPPAPITAGWGYDGRYGPRPTATAVAEDAKRDEAEAKPEERLAAAPPRALARPKRPAPEPVLDEAKLKAAAPPPARQAVFADALVEGRMAGEAVMVGGRMQVAHGFDIGQERKRRGRRIRDKDWDREVAGNNAWGWAPVRQFPVPSYDRSYDGPRVDFRETIYWNPSITTDADGKAQVTFPVSDAITAFRATAEGVGGGLVGRGDTLIQSKLPVSLAIKMPLEVSAGDVIELPVTVENTTDFPYVADLDATFGAAFKLRGSPPPAKLELGPRERTSFFVSLAVVGTGTDPAEGDVSIGIEAANLRDEIEKRIRVVPLGFPQALSASGTVEKRARHELVVSEALPGSMNAQVSIYPSPLATMADGTEAMLAEPVGCFEQASSTNYPNIMILGYLEEHGAAAPELVERSQGLLERGYQKLAGYESPQNGYEWFGGDPGHEALTAYGLMEFVDMKRVWGDVDDAMIDRTAAWLRSRRDGKGGYQQNPRALDSFGRASKDVTDAYITYALTKAGEKGLRTEIARQIEMSKTTKDPYVLALASNTLVNHEANSGVARSALGRLAAMQGEDGGFSGADHSITRSGGVALDIETTALAALAMMKAGGDYQGATRKAITWLSEHRSGGSFGSTQSTVLALEALSTYAKASRRTQSSGVATVSVNGKEIGRLAYEKGHQGAIRFAIGEHLRAGKNVVEVALDSKEALPYSIDVGYNSKVPASSPETAVKLTTKLSREKVPLGEGVTMKVRIDNVTDEGIPMTLARVGLPGGLTFQTWQLEELKKKKLIDFYETREREVILYLRSMAPGASTSIDLELLARVPGHFVAPASRSYLYYTDEHKHWVAPSEVTVTR